jgi:3'(2'), 5'-bisphosphate nucleotidase
VLDELYFAQKGTGAFLIKDNNQRRIVVSGKELENGKILVSRNHLGEYEQEVARKNKMTQVSMGSAGLKICHIAWGDAELYINSSDKSSLWDICAGDIILKESGGNIVDLGNNKILYNKQEVALKNGYMISNGF